MLPRIEHIGQERLSWSKRLRKIFQELFGSRLLERTERELMQLRIDHAKQIAELKQERDTLLNAVLAAKGIPVRQPIIPPSSTGIPRQIGPTRWEQLQADAIRENANAEAEESKSAKEN